MIPNANLWQPGVLRFAETLKRLGLFLNEEKMKMKEDEEEWFDV